MKFRDRPQILERIHRHQYIKNKKKEEEKKVKNIDDCCHSNALSAWTSTPFNIHSLNAHQTIKTSRSNGSQGCVSILYIYTHSHINYI